MYENNRLVLNERDLYDIKLKKYAGDEDIFEASFNCAPIIKKKL